MFPHKTRSPPLDFSHYIMFQKRMTETQSFQRGPLNRQIGLYTYNPLHLLAHHGRVSHNLLNYARAHNGMWLHTEFSSMNNLMIPLSLGGSPQEHHTVPRDFQKYRQHWVPQVPQSTQMCIKVATLNKPLIKQTHICHGYTHPIHVYQHSMAISKCRSNSQGFDNKTGNRYYLIYFPKPTIQSDPNHAIV